ncbi:MAG: 50S ribosomal protein L6 [Candidatus Aquicultor secundus]|uniref:Large ribosomal subunit protein uL6 n=1 Tax=Candidatus Aquicultor secundus TaxID=1973895 RepID=A0A2M7T9L4_9ACTN|nr:50S ribosomal protein L6 [Candidatus Aquicultor secundus]NCO65256.1 50S ribosomal protein L6 [Solirubrobacter sp.]OIO86245.1 MAG: 50S ribosomal protein L6 [Candidatus Aquicultor secundus]PIU26408.1 MAG: 50S ribosomal protein L6 [Candidatus Aquicultor secundus]PIW22609.1 MAG: 50S ribosomal protein L6 [Candidatus Aquicultor secundus]PIX53134.1 MAG: 50S ribosomal protein L6 [Candidatus Aquicultor secundus]
MSRIGKMPINLPSGVQVTIEPTEVIVKGPKGQLSEKIPYGIKVTQEDNQIMVQRLSDSKLHRSLHGLVRTLVSNMVVGVSDGFSKTLEIVGVGYRAMKKGNDLELAMGFSHPVTIKQLGGIEFEVPAPNRIIVKGANKQVVGEIAANIRSVRPPEPYKGKGIKYEGEHIRRKVGKTAK